MKLIRPTMLLAGILMLAVGLCWPVLGRPVIVRVSKSDLGTINGFGNERIAVRFINVLPTDVEIRDEGCGCSAVATPPVIVVSGLHYGEIVYEISTQRMREGAGELTLNFSGISSSTRFHVSRKITYLIKRRRAS